jgi:hypothetical protein
MTSSILNTELRRKIQIKRLAGLTVSKDPDSNELVIHVLNEHDLRLKSNKYVFIPQ